MKMKALFALLILTAPAYAQEDCILTAAALNPVLREDAQNHKMDLNKQDLSILETAELQDGTKITYAAGGCAHYAFSYTFENIPGGVPVEPDDPFAYALSLLAKIPFREGEDESRILEASLKEQQEKGIAAFENDIAQFSCGDAFCSLEFAPDHVTIGYDFAL